ncbi:MAG: acyl--CoA ligase [Caulobacteraceae bacterium]|nr:acyl--CoA ligase [Caulobacteraceae bacterium]
MLRWIAERYADREAQVRGARRITFRQLERRSAELARGLLAQGIGKGSRIALLMPNGPDFTIAFMAAARIGAVVAPLSTLFKARELAWALRHGDFQMLMIATRYLGHDYLARLEEAFPTLASQSAGRLALPEAPYLRSILTWGEAGGESERGWAAPGEASLCASAAAQPMIDEALLAAAEASVTPADLLCMIFTSGSTAEPKAVVHTHGGVMRVGWQKSQVFWGVGAEGERLVSARPHFWVAGFAATLIQSLQTGSCLIDPDEHRSGADVVRLIETEGATAAGGDHAWIEGLTTDPALAAAGYAALITALECVVFARRTPEGLRPLNPARAARQPLIVPTPIEQFARSFGMTETLSAHTSIPAGEVMPPDRQGWCGRPMPGVALRLCDPATGEVVERGEVGEVQVRGYNLMHGLYKKERSQTFTADGWYRTGDLAVMDDDGYVKFYSRMGEMLKVKGANVAPAEVEERLNAQPQVLRSAVVGLPAGGDTLVAAAVELHPGHVFDEAALREAVKQELSSYKAPKRIFALKPEDFPLTSTGKIHKPTLARNLAAMLEAEGAV